MAKRKPQTTQDSAAAAVQAKMEATLHDQLGFEEMERVDVDGEPCLVARLSGRPVLLAYVPPGEEAVPPAVEELAQELGGTIDGGPADYVWATTNGELGQGFMYCWLPDKECQVSRL